MDRYRTCINKRPWSIPAFRFLTSILIALQLMLPSIAFASSSASGFTFGQSFPLDQAGVSVVRLVVTYTTASLTSGCPASTTATGLGALVGSFPSASRSNMFTDWVLTDGSLVDPEGVYCGTGSSTEQLYSIHILTSTAYANDSYALLPAPLACSSKTCDRQSIICQISPGCGGGGVLIPFTTVTPQPFIDLAATAQVTPTTSQGMSLFDIELTSSTSSPSVQQASQFLTPAQANSLTDRMHEMGMPIVNSSGQLVDMQTQIADTGEKITSFVTAQLKPATHTNALHDAWNAGISDYYAGHYAAAVTSLQKAKTLNSQFQAPSAFLNLPALKNIATHGTPTTAAGSAPSSGEPHTNVFGFSIPNSQLIWLFLLVLVVLIILLVLLSLMLVRRQVNSLIRGSLVFVRRQVQNRQEQARFKKEQQAAAQQAQRVMEEQQLQQTPPVQATLPVMNTAPVPKISPDPSPPCPNCHRPIPSGAAFCANCGFSLSPAHGAKTQVIAPPAVNRILQHLLQHRCPYFPLRHRARLPESRGQIMWMRMRRSPVGWDNGWVTTS